jgi:hypothetical protein
MIIISLPVLNSLNISKIYQTSKASGRNDYPIKAMVVQSVLRTGSSLIGCLAVMPLVIIHIREGMVDDNVVAWMAIIGLPVKSILNPVVFTFAIRSFRQRVKQRINKMVSHVQ